MKHLTFSIGSDCPQIDICQINSAATGITMEVQKLTEEIASNLQSGFKISTVPHCVHELVLNSLDAAASDVAVRINLETLRIQVVDNGEGITKNNLELIGERYVTNKCFSLNDYKKQAKFYGFRGESLASIRDCCSKLTIMTRSSNDLNTYCKTLDDTNNHKITVIKHRPSIGTTITIEGFFYNLPVRQKSINAEVELTNIQKLLESLSIIRPSISFTLRNDISKVMIYKNTKVDTVEKAIMKLNPQVDPKFLRHLKVQKNKISATCLLYKKMINTKIQYIYINKRQVECNQLQKIMKYHLTKSNFDKESNKRDNKFLYVLNINCPYIYVDLVPTGNKYNVDFKNWEIIIKCIEKILQKLLAQKEKQKISTNDQQTSPVPPPSMPFKVKLSGMNGTCKYNAKKRKSYKNSDDDNGNQIMKDKSQTKSADTVTKNQVANILKRTNKTNNDLSKKCKKGKTIEKKLALKPSHRKKAVKKMLTTDFKINKKNFHNIFGKNETFTTSSREENIDDNINEDVQCDNKIITMPNPENATNRMTEIIYSNEGNNVPNQVNPYDFGKSSQNVNNQSFGKMIIMDKFLKSILRLENDAYECDTRKSTVSFSVRIKSKKTVKHLKNKKQSSVSNVSVAQMINKDNYSDDLSFTEENHEFEFNFENQINDERNEMNFGFSKNCNNNYFPKSITDFTINFPSNITECASKFVPNISNDWKTKFVDNFTIIENKCFNQQNNDENKCNENNNYVPQNHFWPYNPITGKRIIDLCFESVGQPIFDINKNRSSFHIQTQQLSIDNNDDNKTLHFSRFEKKREDIINSSILCPNEKTCSRRKDYFGLFEPVCNKQLQNDFENLHNFKETHDDCVNVRKCKNAEEQPEESREGFEILKIGFDLNNDDFIENRRKLLNTDKHFSSHISKEPTKYSKTKRYHREIDGDDDFEPIKFIKKCRMPNYLCDYPHTRSVANLIESTNMDNGLPFDEFKKPEISKKFKKVPPRPTNTCKNKDTMHLFKNKTNTTKKNKKTMKRDAENYVFPKPILKQGSKKDCVKQRLQETTVKDYEYPNYFTYKEPFAQTYNKIYNNENDDKFPIANKSKIPISINDYENPNYIFTDVNEPFLPRKCNMEYFTHHETENSNRFPYFYKHLGRGNVERKMNDYEHRNMCGYDDIQPIMNKYRNEERNSNYKHNKFPLLAERKPETVVKEDEYPKMSRYEYDENVFRKQNEENINEAFSIQVNEGFPSYVIRKPETVVKNYDYPNILTVGNDQPFLNKYNAENANENDEKLKFKPSKFALPHRRIPEYVAQDTDFRNICLFDDEQLGKCKHNEEKIRDNFNYFRNQHTEFRSPLKHKPETVVKDTFEDDQLGTYIKQCKGNYGKLDCFPKQVSKFSSPHKRKSKTVIKDYEDPNLYAFENHQLRKHENKSKKTKNEETKFRFSHQQKPEAVIKNYMDSDLCAFEDYQLRNSKKQCEEVDDKKNYFQKHKPEIILKDFVYPNISAFENVKLKQSKKQNNKENNSIFPVLHKRKPETLVKDCKEPNICVLEDNQSRKHMKQSNEEYEEMNSKFPFPNATRSNNAQFLNRNEVIDHVNLNKPKEDNNNKLEVKNNKSKMIQTGRSLNKDYAKEIALQTSPDFFQNKENREIIETNVNEEQLSALFDKRKDESKSYDLFSEAEFNHKMSETETVERDRSKNLDRSKNDAQPTSVKKIEESTNTVMKDETRCNESFDKNTKFTILSDVIINPKRSSPQKDIVNDSKSECRTIADKTPEIAKEKERVLNEAEVSKIDIEFRSNEKIVNCEYKEICLELEKNIIEVEGNTNNVNEKLLNCTSENINQIDNYSEELFVSQNDKIIIDKTSSATKDDNNIRTSIIEVFFDTESVKKDKQVDVEESNKKSSDNKILNDDLTSLYFHNKTDILTDRKSLQGFNVQQKVINADDNIAQSKTSLYEDPTFEIPDGLDIFASINCKQTVTLGHSEKEREKVQIKNNGGEPTVTADNNEEMQSVRHANNGNSQGEETQLKTSTKPWESNLNRLTDLIDNSLCNLLDINVSNDHNVPEQQNKQNIDTELPQKTATKTSFGSTGSFFSKPSAHQDIFASSEENRTANNVINISLDIEDFKEQFSKEFARNDDLNIFETKLDAASNCNEETEALNMTFDVENLKLSSRENITAGANVITNVLKESNTFIFSKRLEDVPKGFSPILQINEPTCTSLSSAGKNKLYDALVESYQKDLDTIKWKNILGNKDIGALFKAVNKNMMSSIDLPNIWKCGKLIAKPINTSNRLIFNKNIFVDISVIGQMDSKFIVVLAENRTLLLLFDQHAVHERIRVEKLSKEYMIQNSNVNKFTSIALNPKIKIELNKQEYDILQKYQDIFNNFGLKFSNLNTSLEVVDGPTCLANKLNKDKIKENIIALIDEILDLIQNNKGVICNKPKVMQAAINSEACRGAIMFGDTLNLTQCNELINDLSLCNLPFQCAHGRPTLAPILHLRDMIEMDSRPNLHNLLI